MHMVELPKTLKSTSPEYMHLVLRGVLKLVLGLWLKQSIAAGP